MSEENPYAWQSAEYAQNGDREMFDQEARMRIAEALHTSHFPMMCFAILLLLGGLFLGGLTLFATIVSARNQYRFADWRAIVEMLGVFVVPMALAVAALFSANWLWSCAVSIDRARKRLTIASVATAVEAQSLFWKKTGRMSMWLVLVVAIALVAANSFS